MAAAAVEMPVIAAPASSLTDPPQVQTSLIDELKRDLKFDPEEIKKRYLLERDKRLRKDGNEQYKQFRGQFQHYLTDPYTPRVERDPVDIETDFMVLGGGFGGLCLAARLVEAGITDIKILDKGGDFGGTWYWNRYPGAACDIGNYSE
jgi:cyclohexanone monooxygenase